MAIFNSYVSSPEGIFFMAHLGIHGFSQRQVGATLLIQEVPEHFARGSLITFLNHQAEGRQWL